MDRETFDKKRDDWRKGVTSNKSLGALIAQAAGEQFAEHGDTSYIADFYSDINSAGKNYVRKSAYLAWLVAHFPVKMEQNKFVKDHDLAEKMNWNNEEARKALVSKAAEKPFFDFAPEAEIVNFKADTVIESIEKAAKRFRNSKHYKAENPEAVKMLDRVDSMIKSLKAPTQEAA